MTARKIVCIFCLTLLATITSTVEIFASNQQLGTHEYCEAEVFEASCKDDEVILIHSANYGRMKFGRCVESDYGYVGCQTDVLHLVDKWCSGQRSCQVPVPNSAFKSTRPCPKDLKPYFEVSYSCEKVVSAAGQSCAASSFMLPEALSGYISNFVTMETRKGSADCPWMIQAKHGQQINITLIDFGRKSPTRTNSAANDYDICHVYAVIRERSKTQGLTVCSGQERAKHIYTSVGHAVEIRVLGGSTDENPEYFLLKYEVLGCSDPKPPENMWIEREKDVVVLGCDATGQKWRLVCVNSEWQGDHGNCTIVNGPTFGEVVWGTLYLPFEVSLVIVVAIAVGIGIVILAFGLICMRSCRRQGRAVKHPKPAGSPQKPVHPVQPQRADQNKRNSDIPNGGSQGSLPPPPAFLMDQENTSGSENEYSYISEMPPPPSTPPPTYTPDLPPPPSSSSPSSPKPGHKDGKESFPPPPPPVAATILVQPEKTYFDLGDKRRSPHFGDVSHGANIGKYRVVQEKTYDVRNNDWKFPPDCKYTITSAPAGGRETELGGEACDSPVTYSESPKYFELDPKAVPSCNGFYSPSHVPPPSPGRNSKIVDFKSLHRPKDKSKNHRGAQKQKKSNKLGTGTM